MAIKNLPTDALRRCLRLGRPVVAVLASLAMPSLSQATCQGMVLHAHRGSPNAPENALSAVQQALASAWDGAEIDIQQLRDGQWVLHHDLQLGRTTSLQGRRTADIDSGTWKEVRMKDRQGRLTAEKAPFLRDVADAASRTADKVLNVEIKQGYTDCGAAEQATSALARSLPGGQWFLTSVDRRHLRCARQLDPNGYLGQIVLDAQALALSSDNRLARANAARLRAPVIDQAWLRQFQADVGGGPAGIHIDINTLQRNPGLLALSREMNVPVFTYFLGSDKAHAQALAAARKQEGLLPSGAIINGQPDAFCRDLNTP